MAKIVKDNESGLMGVVVLELQTGWDVVFENKEWVRKSPGELFVVGETDRLRIPPPPATLTTQQETVASALDCLAAWRTR